MPALLYPPTRPQPVGQVLDAAFRIFQASLVKCLPLGILSMLAGQTANLYQLAIGKSVRSFGGGDPIWWALYGIGIGSSILFLGAMVLRQWHWVCGERTVLRAELLEAGRRLPALILVSFLVLLLIGLGIVALIVPGLYLMVAFSPIWAILLVGRRSPLAALRDSLRLMKGEWWHSSLVLSMAGIVTIVFYIVAFALMAIVLPLLGTTDVAVLTAVSVVIVIALGAIGAPFYSAVWLALYGDLQLRFAGRSAGG